MLTVYRVPGGGGTITMQVVRGYLLTPEQTITRKIKEIFLALELEGTNNKEEIFELYVNRIFLGNRSYGIEAASNTYFNKSLSEINLNESATIAAIAQLPSRVNPVKNPRRTLQRRNWILSRMFLLNYITEDEYKNAISEDIKIANNINLYDVEAQHIAELARQEVINRYGLRAYKEGWSVFTTIDSNSQKIAYQSSMNELFLYDKRHGWRIPDNYENIFTDQQKDLLNEMNLSFLTESSYFNESNFNKNDISFKIKNIFDSYPFFESHTKAFVINVSNNELKVINENFDIIDVLWSDSYEWAREKISINELGSKPDGFKDIVGFGDFIYLKNNKDFYSIDQIPEIESSLISIDPQNGEVIAYIGGKNFNESNFDRVRLSFPQSGSSFKPIL